MKRRRQRVSPPEQEETSQIRVESTGSQRSINEGTSDAGCRASWHGTIPELEEGGASGGACGITTRSSSHGNLQQRSRSRPRLKFFKRQSYTVNPSPPSSPSKSGGHSGFKSLFQNIKRGKKSASESSSQSGNVAESDDRGNNQVRLTHCSSRDSWNASTESDSSQPEIENVRTSPEIESTNQNEDNSAPTNDTERQIQNEASSQVTLRTLQRSQSDNLAMQTNRPSAPIPRSTSHPIHTFQIRSSRSLGNQSLQSSLSLFGRARARKSVIKEVEENMTHPAIIILLSVINFILWMFLFTVKVLRITARVAVRLWLWILYTFDFILYIYHRIFNQDPEKTSQNSDYTHIESKSFPSCLDNFFGGEGLHLGSH